VGRAATKHEDVDLNQLVEDVRAELRLETEGRQIEWRIAPLPPAHGDPGLIKQVFANLISNAIKYSRPRPIAVIEIGQEEAEGGQAIFVRDNGVGFNMKFADKLFGVFQRLHREEEFEGTGVGLATVMRIVQLGGGRIWAQAELDKGATFHFTLNGLKAMRNDS
jgi:light-regulated signal transduction histidine kinase (bacteriophytochrome)